MEHVIYINHQIHRILLLLMTLNKTETELMGMQQLANELEDVLLFEVCLVLHRGAGGGSGLCKVGGGLCMCMRVCERGALPGASGGLWQYIY